MLDTDSVSYVIRGVGKVALEMVRHLPSELCISSITAAELRYGADRKGSKRLHRLIDSFTAGITVEPFDARCAVHYGLLASELARRGSAMGDTDTLIAAHAVALKVTLVTNNEKHFRRVHGLKVENWK